MKKIYALLSGMLLLPAVSFAAGEAKNYPGFLNVEMGGEKIADNQPSSITITPTGEGICNFLLPNLTIDPGGAPLPLGDIALENVSVTASGNEDTYKGETKDMTLMGGMIIADVKLDGKIRDNVADMKIDVMWTNTGGDPMPINVTFTTDKIDLSGITGLVDDDCTATYYDLNGCRLTAAPANGLYIRVTRDGGKVTR